MLLHLYNHASRTLLSTRNNFNMVSRFKIFNKFPFVYCKSFLSKWKETKNWIIRSSLKQFNHQHAKLADYTVKKDSQISTHTYRKTLYFWPYMNIILIDFLYPSLQILQITLDDNNSITLHEMPFLSVRKQS